MIYKTTLVVAGDFNAVMRVFFQLGGIVKPNDGACHMNAQGYYSESLNQVSEFNCILI